MSSFAGLICQVGVASVGVDLPIETEGIGLEEARPCCHECRWLDVPTRPFDGAGRTYGRAVSYARRRKAKAVD